MYPKCGSKNSRRSPKGQPLARPLAKKPLQRAVPLVEAQGQRKVSVNPVTVRILSIPLPADAVWIEHLDVIPLDDHVSFRVFVFIRKPRSEFHEGVDVWWESKMSSGKVVSYDPEKAMYYRDTDGTSRLRLGIELHRNPRFDMEEPELSSYMKSPAEFEVTVTYRQGKATPLVEP